LTFINNAQNTDSLKLALKNVKHDTARIKLLNTLSDYFSPGEDQWYVYNEEIIKITEKYADRLTTRTDTFFMQNLAWATSNKGYALNVRGRTLEGLNYFEQALKLSEKTNDRQSVATTLINIGSVYDSQGNLTKSLDYYHRGLKELEKINDKENVAATFINIGNIYKKLKDLTTAMSYYDKSLILYTEIENQNGIANALNYVGMIYDEKHNLETALEYYKKSLAIAEKLRNKNVCAKALNNIGCVYRQLKDHKNAKDYFIKSITCYEEMKDVKGLANTYDNLAKVYLSEGKLQNAYQNAKTGFDMAQSTGNIRAIMNSSRTLKLVFQKQNKFKDAFKMYDLEIKMGDSINNQETQKAALKKRLQYDYERKEIELKAEQDKKDAITKENLKQKERERNYFIVGFGLVLILAIFILRSFRQKQKDNIIIKAQKQLVDAKQKEVLDSIYYAKRIQTALLPSEKYIDKTLTQLNKKVLSCILCLLSFLSFSQNTGGEPDRTMDSLKLALKNATHDTTRCVILNAMVETESDEALWPKYNLQLKAIAEKNIQENTTLRKFFLNHLGNVYNNIGYLSKYQGDIVKALEAYFSSLKIFEELKDSEKIAGQLNNIGEIYHSQGDFSTGLEYHFKSLKMRTDMHLKESMTESLNNIGAIYFHQDNYQKALEYYFKCLDLSLEIGQKMGEAFSLNNIGAVYEKQGLIDKALECHQRSLKIHEQMGNVPGITSSLTNLAQMMIIKGDLNNALVFSLRNIQLSKKFGFPDHIRSSAFMLKKIYQKQNKYKEAFEMYELEIKMRDSIINQETQKAAVKKDLQYTYEKKEMEVKAEQDKKDAVTKEALKQKEKERNYFILGFGIVLVLALFIFRSYRRKQKDNAIITMQKHLVDAKQKEILDSIHYAKRIQSALLPSEKYIDKSLKQLNIKV